MIQNLMLFTPRRPQSRIQPTSNTNLSKGPKGRILVRLKLPNGLDESQHSLLCQILTVSAGQEVRPGTGAN